MLHDVKILQNHLEIKETAIFQHDCAPCHVAKSVTQWLQDNSVKTLPWPGNSPDLSPIEDMWRYMNCYDLQPMNLKIMMT